jgi:hypothetical protein
LGIATVVFGVIAGCLLQYIRKIKGVKVYLKSNYFKLRSIHLLILDNNKLANAALVTYYTILGLPVVLLLLWVILLGVDFGANPALPLLFNGLFVILLIIPSSNFFFYWKVLGCFILFMVAQLVTMGLMWSK